MTKLMSPTNLYDQVDTWSPGSDGQDGRFEITVEGAPVHVRGTMSLREVPAASTMSSTARSRCGFRSSAVWPSGFAAEQAGRVAAQEGQFLKDLLG